MLNPSQQQAVNYSDGHLLIVAGPGTGKTHTITHRIVKTTQLLRKNQKVLAITFTNKAAQEMRERLEVLNVDVQSRVNVGTFHSVCLQILKQYIDQTDLPKDFDIAGESEIEDVLCDLWPNEKKSFRKDVLNQISNFKSTDWCKDPDQTILLYNNALRERGLLDFDDLMVEVLKLWKDCSEILKQCQKDYPFVFVDEYQDINAIQQCFLKMLVATNSKMTAIGDPNQAIYGFRGSDVKFFESFEKDFPNAKILTLSDNYRSAENILSASGQVIAQNKSHFVPELTANIYTQGRLTIHSCATEKAEAEYVVHQIERLVGGTSMFSQDSGRVEQEEDAEQSFGDIAILYRLSSQSIQLQKALDRSGIPYQCVKKIKSDDPMDQICPLRYEDVEFNSEKVSLMSLHASKGLEFSVVFIVGCEQMLLPLNLESMQSNIDEERRLFYVGMTRAKEILYLVHAKKRYLFGKTYQNQPSPFIADIEEELKSYEQMIRKTKPKKKDDQMQLF